MMIEHESRIPTLDGFASLPVSREVGGRVSDRHPAGTSTGAYSCEEVLVIDDRSSLRPAQAVENRLSRLLDEATMPISHLQMRGMLRTR